MLSLDTPFWGSYPFYPRRAPILLESRVLTRSAFYPRSTAAGDGGFG